MLEETPAGENRDSLEIFGRGCSILLLVQQLAGIKYSHSEVHKIIIAPQQLGKTLTVRPLDVDVHAHPHAAHHGLHVVRHLHLLAAVGLSGLNFTSHFAFPKLTVQPHSTLGSITSFKTGPLTARCKEFTH